MDNLLLLAMMPFSVWRLSNILVSEEGPLDLAVRIRKLVGVYYDEFSQPCGNNVVAKAFTCLWCLSIWVSLFFMLMLVFLPESITIFIEGIFCMSALAIMIDKKVDSNG